MTKKELKIKYINDKKALKKTYKDNMASLKAERTKLFYQSDSFNPPKRHVLEEIGNAISHGVGVAFSVIAFLLMITHAKTNMEIFSSIVYFVGLFLMFLASTLYHSFKHGGITKRIFRRFDYCCIYLLIGATFTPILLCYIKGVLGVTLFIIQWLIIITGVTFIGVFGPTKLTKLHYALYFILGWSGLIIIPTLFQKSIALLTYILLGGIIYSLGIIPFALKKRVAHFIWHFFVLFASIIQFIGIYNFIFFTFTPLLF